jgi:hypothetical protein
LVLSKCLLDDKKTLYMQSKFLGLICFTIRSKKLNFPILPNTTSGVAGHKITRTNVFEEVQKLLEEN